ncbi:DinB family protein [Paenibacillus tarimensis]|uniref:DinB family protein n=1 Tax=Paenibacillus tarimensis TaxID=416012 RepID=UPI001F336B38|nr:DinB family protein [Paenibacillus tarimensis]MCF2944605.1 damage-inducible protein DinB [Paenibacillus tarimensis]
MKLHFIRLFEHVWWADNRIAEAFLEADGDVPEKALRLFTHVLAAEQIWLMRLSRQDASQAAIWPRNASLAECRLLAESNKRGYRQFLEGITGENLSVKVVYRNSKGALFETPAVDILAHVSLHGSYHRGQIASHMRLNGLEPANTDYIAYVREM